MCRRGGERRLRRQKGGRGSLFSNPSNALADLTSAFSRATVKKRLDQKHHPPVMEQLWPAGMASLKLADHRVEAKLD